MDAAEPEPSTPQKRSNFSCENDVILLRQIQLDLPSMAKRSCTSEAWDAVANKAWQIPAFSRENFSGKKAQNRFLVLLEKHKCNNREPACLSDVSEEYTEKMQLLDELLALYDDSKKEDVERSTMDKLAKERSEEQGRAVRESAMSAMGKRKRDDADDSDTDGRGKFPSMMKMLMADSENELQFRGRELAFRQHQRDNSNNEMEFQHKQFRFEREERKIERDLDLGVSHACKASVRENLALFRLMADTLNSKHD